MTVNMCPYLTVPRLGKVPGLVHGFGDARWGEADFMAFAERQGLRPVIVHQLHSDVIRRLEKPPAKKLDGDALMTNIPGLLLVIRTADCLPVLLVDDAHRAVAAVHCGWRGTEKRILEKAVRAMGEVYGSAPEEMLAALGPCIGPACYEVGPEVKAVFLRAGFSPAVFSPAPGREKKALLDLREANAWLLRGSGFRKDRIFGAGPVCTHCETQLLSYRRNPHDPRRMYNFIGLI